MPNRQRAWKASLWRRPPAPRGLPGGVKAAAYDNDRHGQALAPQQSQQIRAARSWHVQVKQQACHIGRVGLQKFVRAAAAPRFDIVAFQQEANGIPHGVVIIQDMDQAVLLADCALSSWPILSGLYYGRNR
jgi:hypothetical protein